MFDVDHASRDELIEYLESRGFQCYDRETIDELRDAARDDLRVLEEELGVHHFSMSSEDES